MIAMIQESQSLSSSAILGILALDIPLLLLAGRKHPWIPLMMIFALAPFQQDMSVGGPIRFSIAEINLMLTCLLFVIRKCHVRWGPTVLPIGLYLGVCTISSLLSWRSSTLTSMIQMGLYMIAAVVVFTGYARNAEDFRPALNGLVGVGLILAIAVIVMRTGYVLGLHKNGVGDSLAAAVIVCGELWFAATRRKQRLFFSIALAILAAGLFFSLSRGAWVGASVGLIVILAMRRQFQLMFRCSFVFVPLIAICWHLLPDQDRSYTTGLSEKNWNIKMRYKSLYFAQDRFYESPILGVGVGLRKEYDATNLFWLILAETGVLGIIPFLWIHVSFLGMVWKTQRRLHRNETLYSLVSIGIALITSKFFHGMVDHYWSRGAIMIAWSSVGMATYACFAMRQRVRLARRAKAARVLLETEEQKEIEWNTVQAA
jgi:hypothetical protein